MTVRTIIAVTVELFGLGLIVAGAFTLATWLGLILAGVAAMIVGITLTPTSSRR